MQKILLNRIIRILSITIFALSQIYWEHVLIKAFVFTVSKVTVNGYQMDLSSLTALPVLMAFCALSFLAFSLFSLVYIVQTIRSSQPVSTCKTSAILLIWILLNTAWLTLLPPQSYAVSAYSLLKPFYASPDLLHTLFITAGIVSTLFLGGIFIYDMYREGKTHARESNHASYSN